MPSSSFPPPGQSTPDGLVAVGGELTVRRLVDAYRHGIFPWPASPADPMLWWSPDPRAILPLDGFHASRRLLRRLRSGEFRFTCNSDFAGVIRGCATGREREGGTWLHPNMQEAYYQLHKKGHAHSVEAWQDDRLVGGVYGVATGATFSAESMFHRVRDASKAALHQLVAHLQTRGFQLLDVQQWTPHTATLGAIEINREEFLQRLAKAINLPVTFGNQLETS